MRNSHWLLVLGFSVAQLAMAADTSTELTRIEAETAVLKARARKAEAQAQLATKQAEIAARYAETRRVAQPTARDPKLVGVEGFGDTLYATLEMPDGSRIDARAGQPLSDGSRVVSIRPGEVLIEGDRKRRIRLTGISPSTYIAPRDDVSSTALPALPAPSSLGGAAR